MYIYQIKLLIRLLNVYLSNLLFNVVELYSAAHSSGLRLVAVPTGENETRLAGRILPALLSPGSNLLIFFFFFYTPNACRLSGL